MRGIQVIHSTMRGDKHHAHRFVAGPSAQTKDNMQRKMRDGGGGCDRR